MKLGIPAESKVCLADLPRWLEQVGYGDFCNCFDPLRPRLANWENGRLAAPPHLRRLIDLFLLGQSVRIDELDAPAGLLEDLLERRILHRGDGGLTVSLAGLMLTTTLGHWLLCHPPRANPTLYFGDDSMGLAFRNTARPGQRALDLCAGPGIQGIHLASYGADVDAVELNPIAAALAQVNARLNGLQDRVRVLCGDLYAAVPSQSYDVICANPPLLPIPDEMPYPFVGHGGSDGMSVTRRIVEGAVAHLNVGGQLRTLGTTFSDGYVPLTIQWLRSWCDSVGWSVNMFIVSHHNLHDGSAFFEGLCETVSATGRMAHTEARQRYRKFLDRGGFSHLCAYFVQVVHRPGKFQLIDVAGDTCRGLWFVE